MNHPSTRSRNPLPALKNITLLASTLTASPVFGLRPTLDSRSFRPKLPKPLNSTRWPLSKDNEISSKMVSTTVVASLSRKIALG
jgi:hypothetical protein